MNLFCKQPVASPDIEHFVILDQKYAKQPNMSCKTLRLSFWRLSSHQSRHRSSWPWPTSVCFALIWPPSFAVQSVKRNTCGCLAELSYMFLCLYRAASRAKSCLFEPGNMCGLVCLHLKRSIRHMSLKAFHHRKFQISVSVTEISII